MPTLREHLKLDKKLGLDTKLTKEIHTRIDEASRQFGSIHRLYANGREGHGIVDIRRFRRYPYDLKVCMLGHLVLDTCYKTNMIPREPKVVFVFDTDEIELAIKVVTYFDVTINKLFFPPRNYKETIKLKNELEYTKDIPKKIKRYVDLWTKIRVKGFEYGLEPCSPVLVCVGDNYMDRSVFKRASENTIRDFINRYGKNKSVTTICDEERLPRYLCSLIVGGGGY